MFGVTDNFCTQNVTGLCRLAPLTSSSHQMCHRHLLHTKCDWIVLFGVTNVSVTGAVLHTSVTGSCYLPSLTSHSLWISVFGSGLSPLLLRQLPCALSHAGYSGLEGHHWVCKVSDGQAGERWKDRVVPEPLHETFLWMPCELVARCQHTSMADVSTQEV